MAGDHVAPFRIPRKTGKAAGQIQMDVGKLKSSNEFFFIFNGGKPFFFCRHGKQMRQGILDFSLEHLNKIMSSPFLQNKKRTPPVGIPAATGQTITQLLHNVQTT